MKTTSAPTLRTASRSSGRMNLRLKVVKPLWMLTVITVNGGAAAVVSVMSMRKVRRREDRIFFYCRAAEQGVGQHADFLSLPGMSAGAIRAHVARVVSMLRAVPSQVAQSVSVSSSATEK